MISKMISKLAGKVKDAVSMAKEKAVVLRNRMLLMKQEAVSGTMARAEEGSADTLVIIAILVVVGLVLVLVFRDYITDYLDSIFGKVNEQTDALF